MMVIVKKPLCYAIKDGEIGVAYCNDQSLWDEQYAKYLAYCLLNNIEIDIKEGWNEWKK